MGRSRCLGDPGKIVEEDVPVGEEPHQHELEHVALADHRGARPRRAPLAVCSVAARSIRSRGLQIVEQARTTPRGPRGALARDSRARRIFERVTQLDVARSDGSARAVRAREVNAIANDSTANGSVGDGLGLGRVVRFGSAVSGVRVADEVQEQDRPEHCQHPQLEPDRRGPLGGHRTRPASPRRRCSPPIAITRRRIMRAP